MTTLLWLVPALPLAGFVTLALAGGWLARSGRSGTVAWIGVGSVGLSAAGAVALAGLAAARGSGLAEPVRLVLWRWIAVAGFTPRIGLYLDPLALLMVLVVTGVGFLIHLYSAESMAGDPGYSRFFAYLNLFVASMLVLVLADDLLLLYLGWEGVGLCSYLLIGFWYRDPENGRAARKAFIVTRVGDAAMAVGLFLLVTRLGTLDVQALLGRAAAAWTPGEGAAVAAALLLLAGAVGKSAQLPLQTWLPDAMAGPTPVSALIHAATMVTAGVYLIARTHTLFELAPRVLTLVALIGAATLLVAGFSALAQRDIKRILAYSTISQIGYMFLALGVGAWSAAAFHLMTHAFFKALLFLGAGAVLLACHDEHDIFRLGGLEDRLPVTYWTFLAGAAALAGFPLVTAGFYSKDEILWRAWTHPDGGHLLWAAGFVGVLVTGLYAFRLVFVVFFGEAGTAVERRPGWRITVPLVVLGILSLAGGFVELPRTLGGFDAFSRFLEPSFAGRSIAAAAAEPGGPEGTELLLQALSAAASLAGIGLAWLAWGRPGKRRSETLPGTPRVVERFWRGGWGFDTVYAMFLVRPFLALSAWNRGDLVDALPRGIAGLARAGHRALSRTQNGRLRWYAAAVAAGGVVLLALALWAAWLAGTAGGGGAP